MEWPKTVTGWVALAVAATTLIGLGGFAGIWRWLVRPIEERIVKEREDRERAIDQITNREHGFLTLHKAQLETRLDRHQEKLKVDIDQVGAKVNEDRQADAELLARTRKLEDQMRDSERDRQGIHRELGTTTAEVRAVNEKVTDMAVNIIGSVQTAKEETLRAVSALREIVNELGKQVAVIGDRQERQKRERPEERQ